LAQSKRPNHPAPAQALRPKLTAEQKDQLMECFELMDADGSGAIDADEMGAAFKVCVGGFGLRACTVLARPMRAACLHCARPFLLLTPSLSRN